MRRILEAAAAAARGGRRREINGAIVLAAIIGDGKSAAAQILSALGLTFEGAIRALQSKPAPAPEQRALPAPDAEAFLAGARERVQSRTGSAARRLPTNGERAHEDAPFAEPESLHVEEATPLRRRTPITSRKRRPRSSPAHPSDLRPRYEPPTGYETEAAYAPVPGPASADADVRARRLSRGRGPVRTTPRTRAGRASRHPSTIAGRAADAGLARRFPRRCRSRRARRLGTATVAAASAAAGQCALRSAASRGPWPARCRRSRPALLPRRVRGRPPMAPWPEARAPRRGRLMRRRRALRPRSGRRRAARSGERASATRSVVAAHRDRPAGREHSAHHARCRAGADRGARRARRRAGAGRGPAGRRRRLSARGHGDQGHVGAPARARRRLLHRDRFARDAVDREGDAAVFGGLRQLALARDAARQGPAAAAADHLGAHGERRRAGGRDGAARSGDHGARAHQLRQGGAALDRLGRRRPWPAACSPSSARAPSTPSAACSPANPETARLARSYVRSATMPAMVARSSSMPRPFSDDVTMTCGKAAGCLASRLAVASVTAASSCGLILSALVSTA